MAAGMMRLVTKARNQPYRKKGRKRVPKASKALKKVIQKEIKKGQEKKFVDNYTSATGAYAAYTIDNTAEVVPSTINTAVAASSIGLLPGIIQGTTQQQRIGDEIRVTNLSLKFRVNGLTTTSSAVMYVVRYPQCGVGGTGYLPTIANIWSQVSDIAVSHRNPDYMNEYHILGRIVIQCTQGTSLNREYSWSKSYKGAGLKVEYDATGGALDDVEFNNIFLIAQSNNSDDVVTVSNGVLRVTYTDS